MLGFTIPQLILFVAAFALYIVRPSWLMLLWLISEPLLAPFMVIYSGVADYEEQLQLVWGLWGVFNRLFILILLIEIVRGHHLTRKIKPLIAPIVVLCVYLLVHNLITHFNPPTIIREWLFVFYTVLPLFVFLLNKKLWPSLKSMVLVVFIVCIVQIVFIPLNLSGVFAYTGRYMELVQGTTESALVSGTFIRSNSLADYLSIVYLFITIDYFTRKSMSLVQYLVLTLVILIPMTFTGSKLPIIVTFLNVFLCVVIFYRKKLLQVGVTAVLLVGVMTIAMKYSTSHYEENEGLNRIVEGVGSIVDSKSRKSALGESTFGISAELIDRYFWSSPIVGHGNAYDNDDNAYRTTAGLDVPGLVSDAALAFYLVEYGLVGLLLFFYLHYSIIKFSSFPVSKSKQKYVILLIFVFFVLFSVTERGLFNRTNIIFILAYMFGLARYNEEKQILSEQRKELIV